VSFKTATDGWAVGPRGDFGFGYGNASYYNGSVWRDTGLNDGYGVTGVSDTGSGTVWTVGYTLTSLTTQADSYYYNGSAWVHYLATAGNSNDNHFNAVSALGTRDVWAVGFNGYSTLVEHFVR
jgi:hypothetical protein